MGASAKIAVAIAALAVLLPANAFAAYPGSNGNLIFEVEDQHYFLVVTPEGNAVSEPLPRTVPVSEPAWSPDGEKVLYTRGTGESRQVWVMNADGTGNVQVPTRGNYAFSPTWSPDGTRFAYVSVFVPESGAPCRCHLHSVEESNLDGSQSTGLYGHFDGVERFAAVINDIEWSPRGEAIAITRQIRNGDNTRMLMVIGPSGNRFERTLTGGVSHVESPAWSPDGERLAFVEYNFDQGEVYTMKPDGSDRRRVTNNSVVDHSVEWSPNGAKLVVSGADRNCQNPPGPCGLRLRSMNPDGTGEQLITTFATRNYLDPDWQPVVGPPPAAGYVRPKTARSMRVPLVPAVDPCAAPNRTHGPPLAFGSCSPPVQSSPAFTVGTPEVNGAPANSAGFVRIKVVAGDPSTEAQEADIQVMVYVTDVRCGSQQSTFVCSGANPNDSGPDDVNFTKVEARLFARITDRYNLPTPGGRASGTTAGFVPYGGFGGYCHATPDRSTGGECVGTTSMNAIYPGTVREGLRTNIELRQIEVYDNGGDNNSGQGSPEKVFLRQGLFVP